METINLGFLRKRFKRSLNLELLEDRCMLSVWNPINVKTLALPAISKSAVETFELFQLDSAELKSLVEHAPREFTEVESQVVVTIPRPDRQMENFIVYSSPIMHDSLAAKFPHIQTFSGIGLDDPLATIRFDITPIGFHAQVLSPSGSYYIDPYAQASDELYISYHKKDNFIKNDSTGARISFEPDVVPIGNPSSQLQRRENSSQSALASRSGSELRRYRLAVATTGEYAQFHGSLNPGISLADAAFSAVVAAVNRVDGVYRTELSVSFELVPNNAAIIFTDPIADPYTNGDTDAMIDENQTALDRIIGNANYDIGHVFGKDSGGVAALGSVGMNSIKAQGVTGGPEPIGDAFWIDYVAHEMGHQFGAGHTFNGIDGSCGDNIGSSAYEPGSGTTIMGYAGICGADNIQNSSDPYFHSVSFDEIIHHVDSRIPNVGTRIPTGNSIPSVDAGSDYVIPARTPFVLTAVGRDANAQDVLTYSWEQRDLGPEQPLNASDNGLSPLFRFQPPTQSPSRYFPRLPELVNNTLPLGEQLPTTNRTLNFRAVVRDNRFSGGGIATDDMRIRVVDTGQAFAITAPNTPVIWQGLSQQTVRWEVAGTNLTPISSQFVDIFFSTDGGMSYPFAVAQRIPNSGQASITVPNVSTSQARIMVRGTDNIFFDISDTNITISYVPLSITLAPSVSTYTENAPPVLIASQSSVNQATSIAGLPINVHIAAGSQLGDELLISGAFGISVAGSVVSLGSIPIATFERLSDDSIRLTMNANVTINSLQTLIRSIAFRNNTDNPRDIFRTIEFRFAHSAQQTVTVAVVSVNDPPRTMNAGLPNILEDSAAGPGRTVAQLWAGSFHDPDEGAFLKGVAVVFNSQEVDQGVWRYSTGGAWIPIGDVNDSTRRLILSRTAKLDFLPAANYFGRPSPLRVRALDDSYLGLFSNEQNGQAVFFSGANPTSISADTADLTIEVIGVNDPPQATKSELHFSATQDVSLSARIPTGSIVDADDTEFSFTAVQVGGFPLPNWLTIDSTGSFAGTPTSIDVNDLQLVIHATDSGGLKASIQVFIEVANVNDPPEQLSFTGIKVPENANGIRVGQMFAFDPDGDRLKWTSSDNRFVVQDNELFLASPLDFENPAHRQVALTLRVEDAAVSPLSASLDVVIQLQDVNEYIPQLTSANYMVLDDSPAGTLIDTLHAVDEDTMQTVRYRLHSGDVSKFSIDRESGRLTLSSPVSIHDKTQYKVFVEAYDDADIRFSSTAQYIVTVQQKNEHLPEFLANQQLVISENLAANTLVGKIQVSDQDDNPLQYELLTLSGGNVNWLMIDSKTGEVRVTGENRFDFESSASHTLQVRVTEAIEDGRQVIGTVPIRVLDANDPPTGLSMVSIYPARQGVAALENWIVQDIDRRESSVYSFSTNDPRFEIRNGKLALKPTESISRAVVGQVLTVAVLVSDSSDPASSATLNASVAVLDVLAWQNPLKPLDVNRDGRVTATDALLIVNNLNGTIEQSTLPQIRPFSRLSDPDFDVSGDNRLTSLDALLVINELNNGTTGGEGERVDSSPPDADSQFPTNRSADAIWWTAYSQLEEESLRKGSRFR